MLDTQLTTKPREHVAQQPVTAEQVLITEKEVALGTAAALGARSTRRRWTEVLVAAMHRTPAPATHETTRPHREYPKHYAFLENAAMARAMERL
jgi:hypothetical protein